LQVKHSMSARKSAPSHPHPQKKIYYRFQFSNNFTSASFIRIAELHLDE
jgi:hypothetical protein